MEWNKLESWNERRYNVISDETSKRYAKRGEARQNKRKKQKTQVEVEQNKLRESMN